MACTDKRTILLYCIISYGRNKFYSEGPGLASSGEKAHAWNIKQTKNYFVKKILRRT